MSFNVLQFLNSMTEQEDGAMATKKYGVVYTPERLADFAAELLYEEMKAESLKIHTILDPACGECALLDSAKKYFGNDVYYRGIDVDKDAIVASENKFDIDYNDAILPRNIKRQTAEYWRNRIENISAIIANPPWSSEKIYDRMTLQEAGFNLVAGQYDSYVLFFELACNILNPNGYLAFIIPDSLFDAQNEKLRRFLTERMQIKVIARLGEKIFEEVNRATTVVICKKGLPNSESKTKCFRLSTNDRKEFLLGKEELMYFYKKGYHEVMQSRFLQNDACNFDVDTLSSEEYLLAKIKEKSISWSDTFVFGRGVEISKAGKIVFCPLCGFAQGYKKSQMISKKKVCINCGNDIAVTEETVTNVISQWQTTDSVQIYVGENIRRYGIEGECFIQPNIQGINYKNREMYTPPKLLVRKTGLGIYAAIDNTGSMTSQTVYILKFKRNDYNVPLEYYLALLNSRVVYYYYLKTYGENEWKSHPYLTKQIIFSLPVREYEDTEVDKRIIDLCREIMGNYSYEKDLQLELLVMSKYGLSESEKIIICEEMNRLPNLSAINNMKVEVKSIV